MRKNAVFHTKSTCFMNFAILWKPCRTPGLSISRILTEEGAAVPGGDPVEIRPRPPVSFQINNDKLASDLHVWSSGHDSACTAHASCCGPRRAFHHHGAGPRDQRPLPSHTCPASCTPHIRGAPAGTVYLPYAMPRYNHDRQQTSPLPGAIAYGLHSIWSRMESAPGSRDAYTGPSVS